MKTTKIWNTPLCKHGKKGLAHRMYQVEGSGHIIVVEEDHIWLRELLLQYHESAQQTFVDSQDLTMFVAFRSDALGLMPHCYQWRVFL